MIVRFFNSTKDIVRHLDRHVCQQLWHRMHDCYSSYLFPVSQQNNCQSGAQISSNTTNCTRISTSIIPHSNPSLLLIKWIGWPGYFPTLRAHLQTPDKPVLWHLSRHANTYSLTAQSKSSSTFIEITGMLLPTEEAAWFSFMTNRMILSFLKKKNKPLHDYKLTRYLACC